MSSPIETIPAAAGVMLILGFGVFSYAIALGFTVLRRRLYHDSGVDSAFDAGGAVSVGLTATVITCKWTWAATLLVSIQVAAQFGISGPLGYGVGACCQIFFFSILSVQLKTKAPGAKTIFQVIESRFGKRTHIVFCCFGLLCNAIVSAMLMLGGIDAIVYLVDGLSVELATMLVSLVICTYTQVGGLGGTFYVNYITAVVIYVILLLVVGFVYARSDSAPLGSIERVFDLVTAAAATGPTGNQGRSYLTVQSTDGLMFAIINLVSNFGAIVVDMSFWQSSFSAKPKDGVYGFLLGGLAWFAIPFALATSAGLAFIALQEASPSQLLTEDQILKGLAAPHVVASVLGSAGSYLFILLLLLAVVSTGSAEVIAVAGLVVYDVFAKYLSPFKTCSCEPGSVSCTCCQLCRASSPDLCECPPYDSCLACRTDDERWEEAKVTRRTMVEPRFACVSHGPLRRHLESLGRTKDSAIIFASAALVPLTLVLDAMGISLSWLYLLNGVLISAAVGPISLTLMWKHLTGDGATAGAVVGTLLALVAWLSTAASRPGGLRDGHFLENTGSEVAMFVGNLVAITSGFLIAVVVSLVQRWWTGSFDRSGGTGAVWEGTTMKIDNPLSPWRNKFYSDFPSAPGAPLKNSHGLPPTVETIDRRQSQDSQQSGSEDDPRTMSRVVDAVTDEDDTGDVPCDEDLDDDLDQRSYSVERGRANSVDRVTNPTYAQVRFMFRVPRWIALISALFLTLVLVILWPVGMLKVGVMNLKQFSHWVRLGWVWAIAAASFIVIVPLVQEILILRHQFFAVRAREDNEQ